MKIEFGENLTQDDILEAIHNNQRVMHSIARYLAGIDYPDEGYKARVQLLLDEMEIEGKIYIDPVGLYRAFF